MDNIQAAPLPTSVPAPVPAPAASFLDSAQSAVSSAASSVWGAISYAWETTTAVPGKIYDSLPTVCGETCQSVGNTTSTFFSNTKNSITTNVGSVKDFTASTITAYTAEGTIAHKAASFSSSAFQTVVPFVAGGVLTNSAITLLQGKEKIKLQDPEVKKALVATAAAGLALYLNPSNEGRVVQLASSLAAGCAVGIYKAATATTPIYFILPNGITADEVVEAEIEPAVAK